MKTPLGLAVILVAGGLTGLVRYYGKGWPWYVSALIGFVLYWPGTLLLMFLYAALGLGEAALSASVTHSFLGVVVGGTVMSASFEAPEDSGEE